MVFSTDLRNNKREVTDFLYDKQKKECIILAEKLPKQSLKRIKSKHPDWDFKLLNYTNLLQNIKSILEYESTAQKKPIYKLFDLKLKHIITYSLESLSKTKKTLFGYALKGRTNSTGILQNAGGKTLGRNCIIVPAAQSQDVANLLDYWKLQYHIREVYEK